MKEGNELVGLTTINGQKGKKMRAATDYQGEVYATADFKLGGTGYDNAPIDETVHAELSKSGAFQYGNGTCMSLEWSSGNYVSFDTRYEKVTPENFTEFALKVLKTRVLDTVTVEVI